MKAGCAEENQISLTITMKPPFYPLFFSPQMRILGFGFCCGCCRFSLNASGRTFDAQTQVSPDMCSVTVSQVLWPRGPLLSRGLMGHTGLQ